ncbi:MAG: hypothetical protein A2070_00935 [Bdellovibrionales bacterium GWC1_52_8]|nr:MAG: hypothetical protein A2Z97_04455 [Bdellovibrionales bacterium GWB1_52_6]OFZ02729.1 MAG: hypothetical protein A2X97_12365 [Bdellovibrionales bacterium GWA1_52_35]OFZ39741.1 MAG: hypothetical protein A2070_00935 [Bdellovibrionales bacterium GWC1_52_8]
MYLKRGAKAQTFSRSRVQKLFHRPDVFLRNGVEMGPFREESPDETVRVFVRASLPGAVRFREEYVSPKEF